MLMAGCLSMAIAMLFCGCSAERFIPENEAILASVKMKSNAPHLSAGSLRANIRQEANSRWFNLAKVPLGIYCMQPKDTTGGLARFFRRMGEAPVIYDEKQTLLSCKALEGAMKNKGYLHAVAKADTIRRSQKKVSLTYTLVPGLQSYVSDVHYIFDDEEMRRIVMADSAKSHIYKGMPLDASYLNAERNRIINTLREKGYYNLNKEYISFRADTAVGDYGVCLTMRMGIPPGVDSLRAYMPYRLRNVTLHEDLRQDGYPTDTTDYRGLDIVYGSKKPKLLRRVYNAHTFLRPDSLYRTEDVRNTYSNINALQAVSHSSIRFKEAAPGLLDCDINVLLNKKHSISTEVEGTNTSGNLGAAVGVTYTNRNLFRGAEALTLKLRGAYEAITGLEGYSNENYVEYSAEAGLRFPSLLVPFVSRKTKQKLRASSDVSLMYDSQNRPEFHRRVVTGTWGYRWVPTNAPGWQHKLDMLSLNYVFMPWISDTFKKEYLEGDDPHYAILRYSYENLFIMKLGYSFTYNSLRTAATTGLYQTNGYQIRFNVETAGNLLYGISNLFKTQRNNTGQYSLFNIAYSQYAKLDFDYAKSFVINDRNSLALHAALGIALPYGNSDILPYEKRYFAGGANSVRGWGVRELGPGSYVGHDGKIDFINQTGNLKLDLSLEYRTHLFWKFHGAAFVDAGNIWNTRNYADQPGGQFRFDRFYKQIAVAYGLGLRFNMDYFILRMDFGMKAINPAIESGRGHYPIINPRLSRDLTFHFAVGLPF